jgi:hypothetical protein
LTPAREIGALCNLTETDSWYSEPTGVCQHFKTKNKEN